MWKLVEIMERKSTSVTVRMKAAKIILDLTLQAAGLVE
jgi:hypothetical protein